MNIDVLKSKYKFLSEIYSIANGSYNTQFRAHRFILLLAIFDFIDIHNNFTNKIFYDDELIGLYSIQYENFSQGNDLDRLWMPYYHLNNYYFWNHQIIDGQLAEYKNYKSSDGPSRMRKIIDYAYFSDDVYDVVIDSKYRLEIKLAIHQILRENRRL